MPYGSIVMAVLEGTTGVDSPEYRAAETEWIKARAETDFGDVVGKLVPLAFGGAAPYLRVAENIALAAQAEELEDTFAAAKQRRQQENARRQAQRRKAMDEFDDWDFGGGFDFGDFGDLGGGDAVGDAGDIGGGFNAGSLGGFLPAVFNQGGGNGSGGMVRTMGAAPAIGSAMAAGGIWLGSLLARSIGRTAAAAVFTAANGVRVRLGQLMPLIRKYGPQTVASALGIGVGSLGALVMQGGTERPKRRRKGISYADLARSRRTIRTIKRFSGMLGLNRGRGRARSYAPRRRYARYC